MHKSEQIFAYMHKMFLIYYYTYTHASLLWSSKQKKFTGSIVIMNYNQKSWEERVGHEKTALAATSWIIPTNSRDILWKQTLSVLHQKYLKWTQTSSDHPKGKSKERGHSWSGTHPQALLLLLNVTLWMSWDSPNMPVFHLYETIKYDTISSIN